MRSATALLHRALDEQVAELDLTDRQHYSRFLQASANALIGIEQLLDSAGVGRLLPAWKQHRRTDQILADLAALQVSANPYHLHRAPPSDAEMWGMLYVLEGSRLGARVLQQRVASSSDDQVRSAARYLTASAPLQWRDFVALLETSPAACDLAQTNAGAIYTFAQFQRSFADTGEARSPPNGA